MPLKKILKQNQVVLWWHLEFVFRIVFGPDWELKAVKKKSRSGGKSSRMRLHSRRYRLRFSTRTSSEMQFGNNGLFDYWCLTRFRIL